MQFKGELKIRQVPACLIMPLWDRLSFHIKRGADVADLTLADALERLFRQQDTLWLITEGNGAFVTYISNETRGAYVEVANLSGFHVRRWAQKMCDAMADFAREQGCSFVRCYGRPAWGRILSGVKIVGEYRGHAVFERVVQ